jgi:tRNA pseudouridine55 synthase
LALEEITPENGHRRLKITATCSKGTYIRTLGEDIGFALGTCAHLSALRRIQTGPFALSQCITLSDLETLSESDREKHVLPVETLLDGHTPVTLAPEDAGRFLSGVRRRGSWPDCTHTAVYGQTPHALLGTAHVTAGELIPGRLLSPIEIQSILEKALA